MTESQHRKRGGAERHGTMKSRNAVTKKCHKDMESTQGGRIYCAKTEKK